MAQLHFLGLMRNNINAFNIIFIEDVPVLIKFDSCMPKVKRFSEDGTLGWIDGSFISSHLPALTNSSI